MRTVRVVNVTRGLALAERAEVADNVFTRGRGLLGRKHLPPGGGLVIRPGGQVHTLFMRFPIDVLHVRRDGTAGPMAHGLPPWRLGPFVWGGAFVVELPAGTLRETGTREGDVIVLEEVAEAAAPREAS
ncbi:MAG TPA: DUF192 domain-containing protein [Chloroflexota bacterium]